MENDKIKWILDEFSRTDNTYKRKAVDSAMELREAITPHLLGILEEARADPAKYAEESFAHIYAVTLLYYFREAKAHPGMVKLFSLPGDWTYRLFGEVWLEQAPYFLYGTCGDSLETLTALVCNSDIDDVYCRVGAVMAMVYAALDEEEKRAPVLEFFKSFLKDLISKYVDKNGERRVSFSADDMELVTLLIDNSMRLHPEEIKEEILRAFEIGLADTSIVEQADFEEILTIEKEPYLKRESTLVRNGMGIDIHSIMGWVYDTEEFKGLYDEATIETQGIGNSTITNLEKINWILKEFEFFDGTYKREAVEAAIELKEEITPYLVHILEDVPTDPKQYGEKLFVHIYASMLLYYFRETSAHQILINAFSLPGEKPYLVFGDITGEYFPAILYATCGGDLSALKKMFHNESIKDMSVRINALEAMAYAAIENEEVRPQVIDFLKDIMHSVLKKYPHGLQGKKDYALEDMRMISLLIWVLCFLYPDELKEKIQTAFDMEIVDLGLISREFVDNTFEKGREQVLADQRLRIKDKLEADIHSRIMWIYETDSDDAESGEDQPAKKATPGTVTKKSNSSKKNNKSKKKKKKKKKAKK